MDSPYWKGPLPGVDVQRRYLWKTFRGKPNSIPGQVEQDSGLKPNSIPGRPEHPSERSDAGLLIVREVFGLVKRTEGP